MNVMWTMGAAATVTAERIPMEWTNFLSILSLHLEEHFKKGLMLTLVDASADDGSMRSARGQNSMIAYLPQSLMVKADLREGLFSILICMDARKLSPHFSGPSQVVQRINFASYLLCLYRSL